MLHHTTTTFIEESFEPFFTNRLMKDFILGQIQYKTNPFIRLDFPPQDQIEIKNCKDTKLENNKIMRDIFWLYNPID